MYGIPFSTRLQEKINADIDKTISRVYNTHMKSAEVIKILKKDGWNEVPNNCA